MARDVFCRVIICPHCALPHELGTKVCTNTGKSLERGFHKPFDETRHPLVGRVLDERYRVLRLIGIGGMGEVLEAETLALKRLVVVKVVRAQRDGEEAYARLLREAQLIAQVHHPNVCAVVDVGKMGDGRPYLVLERLFGEPLSKLMTEPLPTAQVVDVFSQVLSALHAAHGVDIVHRDVKPQNVFLVDRVGCSPTVKVLDFGFAKSIGGLMKSRTLTSPGRTIGTPGYSAPEQLTGEPVDRRADVFSVGVMLQQAFTGVNPFKRGSAIETSAAILREAPSSLAELRPDLPVKMHEVVRRALVKDREDRWPTALSMQQALFRAVR